jgi:hypothetical protein
MSKKAENGQKFFKDILFTKKVIHKPGLIINKILGLFGQTKSAHRTIFYFEKAIVQLQLDTIKKLGIARTRELYYKIGKEVGMQYMTLANVKTIPNFLIPKIIEHMCKGFRSGGCSGATSFSYNKNKKTLILKGSDNIICRKTTLGDFFAGITAGILTILFKRNYGAEIGCVDCPKHCKIFASPAIKDNFLPDINDLEKPHEYKEVNFPKSADGFASYIDLLNFEKTKVEKGGKHLFQNFVVIPSPIHMFGIISKYYEEIDETELMRESLIQSGYSIAEELLGDFKAIKTKMKFVQHMLSAFGWGILSYRKNNNLVLTLRYPPLNKFGFLYQGFILNGFINYIYKKKFKLKSIRTFYDSPRVNITFTRA